MKAKVFRQILQHSYINGNEIIFDVGAYEIFKRQLLWNKAGPANPFQRLPLEEQPIINRWLNRKGIILYGWTAEVRRIK